MPVVVHVAGADTVAPCSGIDPSPFRDVLEPPFAEVPIERVAMRDPLAAGSELGGRHQVDVDEAVAVVVDEGDAAASRLEDVVRGPAAA